MPEPDCCLLIIIFIISSTYHFGAAAKGFKIEGIKNGSKPF